MQKIKNLLGVPISSIQLNTGIYITIKYYKYSFHKKLGLSFVDACHKSLHISKADAKIYIGGFQASGASGGFTNSLLETQ